MAEIGTDERRIYFALLNEAMHNNKDASREVEKAVTQFAVNQVSQTDLLRPYLKSIYINKMNDLIHNLYKNSLLYNTLCNMVADRRAHDIPHLQPHELFPDHWKTILDKKENTESSLNNLPTVKLPDMKCKKCKGIDYYYNSMQTRSGDEPETIFLRCSNCGHTVKCS